MTSDVSSLRDSNNWLDVASFTSQRNDFDVTLAMLLFHLTFFCYSTVQYYSV